MGALICALSYSAFSCDRRKGNEILALFSVFSECYLALLHLKQVNSSKFATPQKDFSLLIDENICTISKLWTSRASSPNTKTHLLCLVRVWVDSKDI